MDKYPRYLHRLQALLFPTMMCYNITKSVFLMFVLSDCSLLNHRSIRYLSEVMLNALCYPNTVINYALVYSFSSLVFFAFR